jgi:CBS domain-containing protein
MSVHPASVEKFITVSPGDPVELALKNMKTNKLESVPVVDEQGRLLGLFSLQILMKNLLPVSVPVVGSFQLDEKIPAAPGIAKRLNKIHTLTVGEVMDRKVNAIPSEAPIWEMVNLLVQHGSPLVIVDQKTGKALGAVTTQSALDELNRMKDS